MLRWSALLKRPGLLLAPALLSLLTGSPSAIAQTCPKPAALAQLSRHTVAPGETIQSIAQTYNLLPATLIGFNPSLQAGKAPVGATLTIPPFNGIRVNVPPGQNWRDVAKTYKIRPDVLFEVNGCQPAPRTVFVPGVNWSPAGNTPSQRLPTATPQILAGSPLAGQSATAKVLLGYGYSLPEGANQVVFHSGVDLAAPSGTPVQAVGQGTIAFAGVQGAYGNLVVINHAEGLQTRYAQLSKINVKAGQRVNRGQVLGTVGTSGRPSSTSPHLHFELRSRSNLGWVAENPDRVLK